jgi:hypothetical protein
MRIGATLFIVAISFAINPAIRLNKIKAVAFIIMLRLDKTFLAKRRSNRQKKPTQLNPDTSGINCVGLLVNGSSGRCQDYPLCSHPKTSIFSSGSNLLQAPPIPLL